MKKNFALMLGIVLAMLAAAAHAEKLPSVGSDANKWGSLLNKYLLVSLTENGTLRQDLNTTFNNLNVSNSLVVIGNIYGEIPDSFKLWNFTNAYDSRNDRFGNANFTALLPPYPTNATITITSAQVTGLGALALRDSLAEGSINSSMVQSGAVTGPKLGANAVTTGKIAPDTIKDSDINPTAGILLSKLAYGASGQITVVNSSGALNYAALSGDATLSNAGVLTVNSIGSGTAITKHISVAVGNVSTNEIEKQECGDLATVAVTGASVGDTVIASPTAVSNGIETKDLMWSAIVSAANTVKIRACNPTDDDINILNTQTWRIDVWQH